MPKPSKHKNTEKIQEEIEALIKELRETPLFGNEKAYEEVEEKLRFKAASISNQRGLLHVLYQRAFKYSDSHRYSIASSMFEECYKFYESSGDYATLSQICRNQARTLLYLGLYKQSGETYFKAHDLVLKTDDKAAISSSLYGIAFFYHQTEERELALEYYLQSLKTIEGLGLKENEAVTYNNMANIYQELHDYNLAIEYYQRALQIKKEINDAFTIASTLTNLGNTYSLLQQYELALHYFNESLELKRTLNNEAYMVSTLLGIAHVHTKCGNVQEALEFSDLAFNTAKKFDNNKRVLETKKQLSEALVLSKDFESAYNMLRTYQEESKELYTREYKRSLAEISVALDLEHTRKSAELQKQIAEKLRHELELKNQELTAQALVLAQKNEMLAKLKEQIQNYKQRNASGDDIVNTLETEIESNLNSDGAWSAFEQQFNTIHQTFMQRLSEKYPTLSPTELRLCALLKINLRTKEIANVLCLSPKSIEIYRFRLRKKLGLGSDVNLTSFLTAM